MDGFPDPDEEYELMYGEELEMMDDFDEVNEAVAKPIASTQRTTPSVSNKHMSILASPALSQISRDGINLNLTPAHLVGSKKTSTPFLDKLKSVSSQPNDVNGALTEIQNIGVKRKRRLEDLFGDIYDIEEEDVFLKKHKTDEERDLDTIAKIIEARQSFQTQINPLKKTNFDRLEALHKFKRENLSRAIPKFPFLTISKDDERIYVRTHSEDFEIQKLAEIKAYDRQRNLLGSERDGVWQAANEIILKSVTPAPEVIVNEPVNKHSDSVDLWVEKYKPKKYIDLLSDESTNRSLLQWMKLWDKVVFNREVVKKDTKPGELSNFNKRTGKFEQTGGWKRKQKRGNLNTELDANNVPFQKIALLHGKPGLGKTTLAHIIAKHAGYVVREMNASDDRTVDAFKQALENGTQMSSVLNQDNRPNCIVLDEIDGAPLPAIDFLIRFISGQVTEKSKKGTHKKKFILKRPIICICNDLYSSSLRNLRQIAFVVSFNSINNSRLAERLMHIANKERVKSDLTSMLALAEKTGGDIRSCLSMIQFFGGSKKPLTLLDVMKSNIGHKDQHKNLFNVWASIFQIQRPKKVVKTTSEAGQVIGMTDMSPATRMEHVLESVNSCGEYDRLIQGVFENYLKQKMHDPNFEGVVEANRWFMFDDCVQTKINTLQNYSIYPYLVYGFVSWHFSFSSMAYPQITYPQKNYEMSQKINTTKLIFGSLKKGIASNLRGIGCGAEVLMDSICMVKLIISPEIRSVSMHLLTDREKDDLKHTVDIIADLGLTFNQLQGQDGTYIYRIDPDIDHLGAGFSETQSRQMSYWSKQTIAREVELEKMRRAKPKVSEHLNEPAERPVVLTSPTDPKPLPNHLQRLIPKSIKSSKPAQLVCKDFFGRVTTKSSAAVAQDEENANDVLVKSPIWFKFKEGFNNAVRTDLTLHDLL